MRYTLSRYSTNDMSMRVNAKGKLVPECYFRSNFQHEDLGLILSSKMAAIVRGNS